MFVIFKYHFQLLSLLYMSWYCKNVRFMSALCRSLNMIILIHIVQTFLLSYNLTPSCFFCVQWFFQYDWGGIIVGVRDSLGITGSVGGSRTINGIKEMTFRNAVKMRCSIFCFIPDQLLMGASSSLFLTLFHYRLTKGFVE